MSNVRYFTDDALENVRDYLLKATSGETGEVWIALAKALILGDEAIADPVLAKDKESLNTVIAQVFADVLAYVEDRGLPLIDLEQKINVSLAENEVDLAVTLDLGNQVEPLPARLRVIGKIIDMEVEIPNNEFTLPELSVLSGVDYATVRDTVETEYRRGTLAQRGRPTSGALIRPTVRATALWRVVDLEKLRVQDD